MAVAKRHFGKICAKHPDLKGERLNSNYHCVRCHRIAIAPTKKRQLAAKLIRLRTGAFDHYGHVCWRCGENDKDVLTFDHIAQNGAKHRRDNGITKNGQFLYYWMKRNNYPPLFRTACSNCNIKAFKLHQRGEECVAKS